MLQYSWSPLRLPLRVGTCALRHLLLRLPTATPQQQAQHTLEQQQRTRKR